ncbi:MAG: DUF3313 domain-containing protein [Syntrophobacteraceae bacterium]|jgi:hypothetical protein|nr:DUF3313 domain-containing protein [Syntrophobacteraceae bacterium]
MKCAVQRDLVVGFVLMTFALAGCQSMKAEPSRGAGFVAMDEMQKREDLPFQKVWVKAGADWNVYRTVYIKEVSTQYLLEANWWQQGIRKDDYEKDVQSVALYMREKFMQAFREDPNRRFQVLQAPAPGSITLELALTELVPSKPLMEALSLAAPYGSGVAVQAGARKSGAVGTVAFEARIVDSSRGTLLAMAADREEAQAAPVNLRAFTWYSVAHGIIDDWAGQFVEIANRRPGQIVKDTSPFTLKPW